MILSAAQRVIVPLSDPPAMTPHALTPSWPWADQASLWNLGVEKLRTMYGWKSITENNYTVNKNQQTYLRKVNHHALYRTDCFCVTVCEKIQKIHGWKHYANVQLDGIYIQQKTDRKKGKKEKNSVFMYALETQYSNDKRPQRWVNSSSQWHGKSRRRQIQRKHFKPCTCTERGRNF